jgi:hypothetical protein
VPRTRVANECASADGRLLAHASAFAFQGTNAHVVLSASSSELCTNVLAPSCDATRAHFRGYKCNPLDVRRRIVRFERRRVRVRGFCDHA